MNVISYLRNVGKSFGYATVDVIKLHSNTSASFAKNTKEFGDNLYQSIKDFKQTASDLDGEKSIKGQIRDVLVDYKRNLIEDLKSGTFYNKQRIAKSEDTMADAMFEDFDDNFDDFDFEFDDDDDNESFDDASDDSLVKATQISRESNKELANAIDVVGQKAAGAISIASVESADYIVQANKQSSKAIYSLTDRGFNQVSTGLAAVNSNISNLVQLAEPLTTHMQNSSVFYTKTTEQNDKIISFLEQIANNTAPKDANKRDYSRKKNTIESLMNGDALDIGAYVNMVKENTSSIFDMVKGFMNMGGGVKGVGSSFSASPLQNVITGAIDNMLPGIMKKTMDNFDKSLQGFFASYLGKLRDRDMGGRFGSIFDLVKGYILPESGYKNSLSTSGYEKGKVDWDGMSRKSLIEVIPTLLSKIAAGVTGEPEQRYDFESGKWKTINSIRKDFEQDKIRYARSAGGDYISYLQDTIRELEQSQKLNNEQAKALKKQVEDYNYKAFHSNSSGFLDIMKDDFDYTKYGLTKEGWEFIRNANKAADQQGRYDLRMQYASNIFTGRDSYGNNRRMQESDGSNLALQLFNGSIADPKKQKENDKSLSRGILGVDSYNHDVFYYLQGIYQFTKHVSDNLGNIGGGVGVSKNSRSKNKRGRKITPLKPIQAGAPIVSSEDRQSIDSSREDIDLSSIDNIDIVSSSHSVLESDDDKRSLSPELQEYKERKEAAKLAGAEFEEDEEKERMIRHFEEFNNSFNESNSKLKDKLKNNKFLKPVVEAIEKIFKVPADAVSGLLNAGMVSMRTVLYGEKPQDGEKGIFGYMAEGMKNIFGKLDDKVDEIFGKRPSEMFKSAFDKIFGEKGEDGKRHGGKFSEFANETGENLRQAKDWFRDLFAGEAADGRKVTKTGMIAVSEGELVIPAEMNPFYHKSINKQKQRKNERDSVRKFYGLYNDGGTAEDGSDSGEGETKKFKISDNSILGHLKNFGKSGIKELGSGAKNIFNKVTGKAERDARAFDPLNPNFSFSEVLYNDKYTVKMGKNGKLMVYDNEEDEKEEKSKLEQIIDNALPEINTKKGAMGAGALIGAGVSLFTGGLVGPILGAGIGAAAGLVIKSDKMQKLLFGDEENEGIAGKKISDFVKNNLDKTVKGGVAGAVGGLLLGSPLLGMVAGSAAGYISSSEKAKKFLFGDEENDGIISKKLQQSLKSAMPRISAGAISGLVMGPFGSPIMNIIAGSAIGYATTHQKFHDWLLSDEENKHGNKKGLIPLLKQKLLDPIVSIFDKLSESIKHTVRNSFFGVSKFLRKAMTNVFKGLAKKLEDTWIGKLGRGITKVAGTLVRTPINMVGGALGRINTHMETKALRKGYSVNDRKLGRKLNAKERMDLREKKGMSNNSKYGTIDKAIAEMSGNKEQLEEFSNLVSSMTDPTKEFDNQIRKSRKKTKELLRNGTSKESAVKISRLLNKNEFDKAKDFVNRLTDIDDIQKEKILDQINQHQQAFNDRNETKGDVKAAKKRLIDRSGLKGTLDKKGIHLKELRGLKDSDLRNIQDLIKDEEAFNKLNAGEVEKNKEKEDKQNLQDSVTKDIPDVLKDIRGILAGDEELKKKYGKKKEKGNKDGEETQEGNEEQKPEDGIVDGDIDEDEETADDGYYKLRDIIRNVRRNGLHIPNHRANRFTRNNGRNDEDSNNQNAGNETNANDANNSELKDGDTKTVFDDSTGQTIKQIYRDPPGTWEVDTTDTDTRKAMETKQQTNAGLASLVNFVPSMGNIFGSLKEGLLGGEKEEEEGFLSKLLGGLGGIGNFLFGGGLGNIISKAIGGVLTTLGVTTLIKMLTTEGGITDKIAEKFGFGKAEAGKAEFQDKDGKTYIEMNGKYVDKETGEEFTGDNTDLTMTKGWGEAEATESLSDKTKDNFVRGTVTGKGSLIGKLTDKIPGMKTVKKLAKKVGKKAAKGISKKTGLEQLKKNVRKSGKNLVKKMASNAENLVREKVGEALPKFIEVLGKVPVLKKVIGKIKVDDMVEAIAKQAEKGTKKAGAKVLKSITSAVPLLNIAFAVVDFTTGYQDASATFKVKEPTFCQKIISAVIRTLKNLIPFIGSLIPDHILVDIFVEYIAPFFGGIDGLEQQREEAEKELEQYNEENNTDMDWEEYNKEVLGNYTWTEKIGNAAKDLGSSIKNSKVGKAVGGFFSKVGKGIGGFFGGGGEEKSASGSGLSRPRLLGFAGGESSNIDKNDTRDDHNRAHLKSLMNKFNRSIDNDETIVDQNGNVFIRIGNSIKDKIKSNITDKKDRLNNLKMEFEDYRQEKEGASLLGFLANKFIDKTKNIVDNKKKELEQRKEKYQEYIANGGKSPLGFLMNNAIGNIKDKLKGISGGASGIDQEENVKQNNDVITKARKKRNTLNKFKETVSLQNTTSPIENTIQLVTRVGANIEKHIADGNIMGIWREKLDTNGIDQEDQQSSMITPFAQGMLSSMKLIGTIPAGVKFTIDTATSLWEKLTGGADGGFKSLTAAVDKMSASSKDGDFTGVWNTKLELSNENDALNPVYKIAFTIAKVFQTVSAVWNVIMNKVKEFTESGIGGGILSIINKFMGNDSSSSETSDSGSSTTTSTDSSTSEDKSSSKDKDKKKKENKKEFVTFEQTVQNKSKTKTSGGKNGPKIDYSSKDNFNTSMSNSNPLSASGSGFVSQLDPKFTNMSLGGSSIADMGCGPASAVMALNNRGKQASMDDAVNEANRYQTEGGTDIGYFGDIFKKNGLNPKYYGVSGGSSLINDIQSGNQVVLMGQDKNNRSKMNSPFGPNNHYVVATGMDHSGNVIVNDPELNRPGAIYSPSILKSVKAAVSAGRSKLKSRSYPKFFGIAGAGKKKKNKKSNGAKKAKDIKEQVYAFFTNNGFTPAAACGIMGNIEAESGWNPALKQVNGPAKGLFQMQGGRFNEMEKIAKKNGKDWTDLDSQLEFFLKDFHSSENNHYFTIAPKLGAKYENVPPLPASSCEKFKKLDDPVIAAAIFMSCWERCAFKDSLSHWTTRRKANAEAYYKKYADKNYVYDGNASFNGTTDNGSGSNDDSGSSSSSSNPGVLNEIIGAFSNAFGIVFGGGEENNSSSSSSDTTGDSSSVADGGAVTWKNGGKDPVGWMESILGKIAYSQKGPRNPDKGSADCSSTVAWAIKKAGGPSIGSSTLDQITNSNLETVWENGGKAPSSFPKNAQRNDVIFYGSGTSSTNGRKFGVNHVDLYMGNGKKINHGGGMGPKIQNTYTSNGSKHIVRIARVKGMTVPADESTKKGKTKKADMSYAKYLKLPKKASNGKPWNKYSPGSGNTIDDQNYTLWKKWQIPKKSSNGKPWNKYSPGGSGNTKDDQYYALWSEMQEYRKKKNKKKSGKGSGLSDTIVNKLYNTDREQRANILDTSHSHDNEIYRAFNRLKEHDLVVSNTDTEEHELVNRTNSDTNQITKGTLNNERIGKVISLDQARKDRIKNDRKINSVDIKHITRDNKLRGTVTDRLDDLRNNRSNIVRNKIENSIPDIKHITRDNKLRGTVTDKLDNLRNNRTTINLDNIHDIKHSTSQDRIRDRLTNALNKEREKRNRTTINLDNAHDIKNVTAQDRLDRHIEQIRKDKTKNSRKIDKNNHIIERVSRDPESLRNTASKIKNILDPTNSTNTNMSHEEFKKIIEQQREERKKNNTNKKIENTKENTSGISKEVALMMKTMITLVEELVGNTKSIEQIYELLGERIPEKTDTSNTNKSLKNSDQTPHHRKYSDEERAQRSLSALKATMDEILAS